MAKLAEPLMGVRNTGKVPNRKLAKSHFLHLVVVVVVVVVVVLVLDKICALV